MAIKSKRSFNAQVFLASAGVSRKIVEYPRGASIFTQGDPCDHVLYIQKGNVQLSVVSQSGREAVVAMLNAGDFFGEGCLTGQAVRMGAARATTDSAILLVDKRRMIALLHKQRGMSDRFIAHMLARNIQIEEDLIDQLFNSSEKRLARILLLLANFGKEGRPEPIIAKVSQETLAEMIGTTRSRVSFFMNKFRKLGLIDYNGSIEIHSSLLNVILRDQPQIKSGSG